MNYFGITDVGKVRQQNQDYFMCTQSADNDWVLLLVCDGMGGAKSGNIASELACRVFSEHFAESVDSKMDPQTVGTVMLDCLNKANISVYEMSLSDFECRGMGTTMVAAFIKDDTCVILNVGDSRAYIMDDTGIRQVTHDHSYVQRLVDIGELTQEEAKIHSSRNVITRAVGTMLTVRGDLFNPQLKNHARLLLASDGLTNMIGKDELLALTEGHDTQTACQVLVDKALERGATDNVTAVIFDY